MENKYYNDAIIGNKNVKATFSSKGELLRLYYPNVDFRQFIDIFTTGVKVNESGLIYLQNDINNKYKQYYTEDTNILNTEIENTYFNLKIKQIDYVMIKENVMIKKYLIKNDSKINLDIDLIVRSKLIYNEDSKICGKVIENGVIQYSHNYTFSVFSDRNINGHRFNKIDENIKSAILQDKDLMIMDSDAAVSYKIGNLKPGEEQEISIFVLINSNDELKNMDDIEDRIAKIRKVDTEKEYNQVKKYWKQYLEEHDKLKVSNIDLNNKDKVVTIYKRTILLFPFLQNQNTGGIVAAIEVDEKYNACGGYDYCWPRDAAYIAEAFDRLDMIQETERFYKVFCKNTQYKSGMWGQRYYTNGKKAPCWSYQVDETAMVIFGIYEHYNIVKDRKFIIENLKMCESALGFLFKYLANLFGEEEKDIVKKEIEDKINNDKIYKHKTRDLWEELEGVHFYSLCSIYAAFESMIKMYNIVKEKYETNRLKIEKTTQNIQKMENEMQNIKQYINNNLINKNGNILKRNTIDNKVDISMLGSVVPFEIYKPEDKVIKNTIEKMNLTIRTHTGGYLRYEEDTYRKGLSPWPIATLWMALYYLKAGNKEKAKECIDFVTNTATELGFLGEQVDNSKMKPNWIIGLGWSHAMYIIALAELLKEE